MLVVLLTGCENAELMTCQEEKQALQTQWDLATSVIQQKDQQIEQLRAKSTETEHQAMASIQTILQKQGEKDAERINKIRDQQQQIQELSTELQNMKNLYENARATLETAEKEKQVLSQKLEAMQSPIMATDVEADKN